MTKTLTEVEVKKTTATHNNSTPRLEEQDPRRWGWVWIAAPFAALTTTCATFLVVRRWLNNSDSNQR